MAGDLPGGTSAVSTAAIEDSGPTGVAGGLDGAVFAAVSAVGAVAEAGTTDVSVPTFGAATVTTDGTAGGMNAATGTATGAVLSSGESGDASPASDVGVPVSVAFEEVCGVVG
jgi:hypothetical protein